MIVDCSRAMIDVSQRREVIDVSSIGSFSRQYHALDVGPGAAEMIVDFGGMIPSLNNVGVLASDIQMEFSMYNHNKIQIEGYLMPAKEGHMFDNSRCHLCHAPIVNQRSETQKRFVDTKKHKGWDAQVEEKTVLIQTYECGTEIIRDTQKRADEVTVGPKCLKFKEAK
jgi:hypothetical protein